MYIGEKAISVYTKDLTKLKIENIDLFLNINRFWTSSTIINFQEIYHKYGAKGKKKRISDWRLQVIFLSGFGGILPILDENK